MPAPVRASPVSLRLRRYLTGADLDEAERVGDCTISRLPFPLPSAVRRLAVTQLVTLGTFSALVAVALGGGALAIIIMPFALGRRGVGLAMVSLFVWCASAVLLTLPLFALRGSARMLRRDARGIAPVRRVAWLTILAATPLAFAGVFGLDYLTPADAIMDTSGAISRQSMLFLCVLGAFVLLAAWTIIVLRAYRRTLPSHLLNG